jgi:hypothetical protein
MDKLSIEQKAKAYDEALKVLHKYDGENTTIKTDRPMTEIEVHYIYGALSVSGID